MMAATDANSNHHAHRRIFVGPMPERVIAQKERELRRRQSIRTPASMRLGSVFSLNSARTQPTESQMNEDRDIKDFIKENARRFFAREGGNADDWGEDEEERWGDEFVKRWEESEWGKLWRQREEAQRTSAAGTWLGTTFEVGMIMGVAVADSEPAQDHPSRASESRSRDTETVLQDPGSLAGWTNASVDFVTAHETLTPLSESESDAAATITPITSRTGLLPASSTPTIRITRADSAGSKDKGKGRARVVQYADLPTLDETSTFLTPGPAPPGEVLGRTRETVDPNTSLAASAAAQGDAFDAGITVVDSSVPGQVTFSVPSSPTPSEISAREGGRVVLRGKSTSVSYPKDNSSMLIRVSYTRSETIPQPAGAAGFDENVNRTTRDLQFVDWGEFLVAWRKDNIEIYRDHATPGKEWLTGHKHLDYVIPLKGKKTKLSLYSFVDLTFCLTCAPTTPTLKEGSRWTIRGGRPGTNIFIFKVKSRSRACDWFWHLWRHMGGRIPRSIDVYNPRLRARVTIDLPFANHTADKDLYRLFDRENVLNLCMDLLRTVPNWKYLLERAVREDERRGLQLAWRNELSLDWVWLDKDVCGEERPWSVACGLALNQGLLKPALEIRLAEHLPTHLRLKDGGHIDEPPSIEGYLDRIRPNTQTKQQLYVVTHGGNLFILNPSRAFPPTPPGLSTSSPLGSLDDSSFRQSETKRGINQVMAATGVCELRTIVAIRRAFQVVPVTRHEHREPAAANPSDDQVFNAWGTAGAGVEGRTEEDDADEGGEGGLSRASDRPRMKMRRSFEILMNTGYVVRFEAHSCQVALEWIERLRALVLYWKSRNKLNAKEEIELAQARRPRLTPQTRVCQDDHEVPPEAPSDLSAAYPAMDTLYNWCVLEGCMPVSKSGKIYVRKGLRGQYKLVQLCLVAGHLIRFTIAPHATLHRVVKSKINLLDAYVCSGYLAAQALPTGQIQTNAQASARRYQDGLETDDRDEDMIFMLWYRPQQTVTNAQQDITAKSVDDSKALPTLSSKHKVLIFKTRSNLERNSWCWAVNAEIEKIVRAQESREQKMRDDGKLVKLV